MSAQEETKNLRFTYRFKFKDNSDAVFNVYLDRHTLDLIKGENGSHPEWTELKNFKCPHCPLNENEVKYCPVAVSLEDIIPKFSRFTSFDEADVTVETENRTYYKHASLQLGVSGLIGIYMVTCGCPVMGKLRPLVRFHLPFTTLEETEFRVLSMYLLAQYFLRKKGAYPDWDLKDLSKIYEDIKILNTNVCQKIADLEAKDTSINSVIVLNNFAEYITFSLDEDMMDEMELLFKNYF